MMLLAAVDACAAVVKKKISACVRFGLLRQEKGCNRLLTCVSNEATEKIFV